ncbi:MAG: hypothetical protein IJN48_00745 [Clostridia bacterium]|nr:hypothetical protein [Clostridia bacterium]
MYVGVPKNYGGTAFQHSKNQEQGQNRHPAVPPTLPHTVPPPAEKLPPKKQCEHCAAEDNKNPLSCLLNAFHRGKSGGLDAEDLLLIGLIALLMGKEGNEDMVFILAMLLLI